MSLTDTLREQRANRDRANDATFSLDERRIMCKIYGGWWTLPFIRATSREALMRMPDGSERWLPLVEYSHHADSCVERSAIDAH